MPENCGRNGITGQAMLGTLRVKRRRWTTTLAALLAVAVAADPRVAHLAFCPANNPSAQAGRLADCKPNEACCSTGSDPHVQAVDFCLAIGTCGCCSHAPAGHQREPDARAAFVSSAPLKTGARRGDSLVPPVAGRPAFGLHLADRSAPDRRVRSSRPALQSPPNLSRPVTSRPSHSRSS